VKAFKHVVVAIQKVSFSKEISQLARKREIKDKTIRGFSAFLSRVELGPHTLTVASPKKP